MKRVSQHSAESRGFSPGAPVSSHKEVDRVGTNTDRKVKSQLSQKYTPKNYHLFKVVENRMQQYCAAHMIVVNNIVQHC